MTLEGPVLVYDRVSHNNFVIHESTELNVPEKIPVAWDYKFENPELVLGVATLHKEGNVMLATVNVTNELFKQIIQDRGKIYCGGRYKCVKTHKMSDSVITHVDKAELCGLGIYESGDEFLYLKVKE